MQNAPTKQSSFSFLQGGGEMGKLMRSKDWSASPVGTPDTWPQSLRTTLSIILNSKFPMFLFWGPDLICFYNDAYRPSLGNEGKHPNILGSRGEDYWQEIWPVIKPLIDQVLAGGEATWSEDQLIPIYRNGKMEDVYWTFSYSPVNDESGKSAGVFVTCNETTDKIKTFRSLEESNNRYLNNIVQAPVAMCIFRGKNHKVEIANELMLELWGKTADEVMNKPIFEGLPEAKGQGIEPLLDNVYNTGEKFVANERPVNLPRNGKIETIYTNFVYEALREPDGTISGIVAIASDVTLQVMARKKLEENEKRLNIVIDASELGTWELNLKTKEVNYSDKYREILGHKEKITLTHDEIIRRLHPEDLPIREKAFNDAFISGSLHYESRLIWPDKSIHWIEGKGKVFYDEQNKPIKMIGTLRDITEEKDYQQELQQREQKFRLLADSMPQHVWTSDTEGNLNYFNKSVFDYSGLTPEQLSKDDWIQIVHPDDREENIRSWMHSVNTGKDFLLEHRFKRHDGEHRWQLSRALPVRNREGKIQMWVGTSTDIDEIKKHEQLKDDFIKMASHELKTPVTTIKGYIQILLNKHADGNDQLLTNSLSIIEKQISKLTKLITDLLDVTKIETGSLQLTKENFRISELIRDVTKDIQTTSATRIEILEPEANISIYADKNRIGQVLTNLLNNAIKYSPKADKVFIKTILSPGELIVSIQDFGIGISRQDHDKIFERFYRVEGRDEKTFPGFGIGLFIVKEIISLHQGKVWVESEKNNGAVFSFSLPL